MHNDLVYIYDLYGDFQLSANRGGTAYSAEVSSTDECLSAEVPSQRSHRFPLDQEKTRNIMENIMVTSTVPYLWRALRQKESSFPVPLSSNFKIHLTGHGG